MPTPAVGWQEGSRRPGASAGAESLAGVVRTWMRTSPTRQVRAVWLSQTFITLVRTLWSSDEHEDSRLARYRQGWRPAGQLQRSGDPGLATQGKERPAIRVQRRARGTWGW